MFLTVISYTNMMTSRQKRLCRLYSNWRKLLNSKLSDSAFTVFSKKTSQYLAVVPREKPHTGAAAREQPRDSPVIER